MVAQPPTRRPLDHGLPLTTLADRLWGAVGPEIVGTWWRPAAAGAGAGDVAAPSDRAPWPAVEAALQRLRADLAQTRSPRRPPTGCASWAWMRRQSSPRPRRAAAAAGGRHRAHAGRGRSRWRAGRAAAAVHDQRGARRSETTRRAASPTVGGLSTGEGAPAGCPMTAVGGPALTGAVPCVRLRPRPMVTAPHAGHRPGLRAARRHAAGRVRPLRARLRPARRALLRRGRARSPRRSVAAGGTVALFVTDSVLPDAPVLRGFHSGASWCRPHAG